MKKIDTVKELQEIEISMLKKVHDLFKKNGLKYFLAYGSLLGAVRHHGFIPWDDDMDIMMTRPDFEKLRKSADVIFRNTDLGLAFYDRNDVFYPRPFAKIINKKTSLRETNYIDGNEIGVFIDIFVLDGVPDNKFLRFLHRKKCVFMKKVYYSSIGNLDNIKGPLNRLICKITRHLNTDKLLSKIDKMCQKYSYESSKNVVNLFCEFDKPMKKKNFDLLLTNYNDIDFYIPISFDEILTNRYGDYMELPPIEERKASHPAHVYWKDEDEK